MEVSHIVPSLEERHGGPSKSVRALANAQARAGLKVSLLSTLEPGQPGAIAAPDDARLETFAREAPLWLCRSSGLAARLNGGAGDIVHHHGLWLLTLRYAAVAARRQGIPLVISPRGMLSGWAYRHRLWRKRLASWLVHPGALRRAAGWHATSEEEASDIRTLGFTQPICVAPNGVVPPSAAGLDAAREAWRRLCPALRGRPVALFYSRFHRKKRIRELLDLWLSGPRGDWFLLLVGVPEEFSVAEISGWIAAAGASDRVAVFDGTAAPAPYAMASLFVLPTHSENFGLVIAEALAAGVPALVTDTTPWRGLQAENAGWCVSWPDFGPVLDRALSLGPEELGRRGGAGRAWVTRDFTWDAAARRLVEFYGTLQRG